MKIYRSTVRAAIVLIGVAANLACTGNYEYLNRDPNTVTDEQKRRDDYAIASAMTGLQSWVVPTVVNACQFTDCLLGGPWGGYFADSQPRWENKISTYNAANNWMSVMFKDIIPPAFNNLGDLAAVTEDEVPLAIGQVIKVAIMHRVTDTYGPIPYTEIGLDGMVQVKYDHQRDIYNRFFEELDEAIETLTEKQTEKLFRAADQVYSGDVVKWIRFANSLKLRLAMRVVYANETLAREKAEEAVSHSVGCMTGNGDNASLKTFGGDGNPIYVSANYNSSGSTTGGDHHASADITSYMTSFGDPRAAAYFLKSTFDGLPYVGLRNGIDIPSGDVVFQYAGINVGITAPLQWMNVAEVMFLKAEGAARGWQMGGTAREFYEEGVRLSFEQWGASGADNYLRNDTDTWQHYVDPNTTYTYMGPAVSTITVAWDDAESDFEKILERIIVQKWIANYTLGVEAWSDRRRTGYPVMMPVVKNGSNGVLADNAIPRRLPYPLEEYQTNGDNVTAAVSTLLGGQDNFATRLWWDCK